MTGRGRALLIIAAGALYSGLSLGGRMFYLSAVFAALSLLLSLSTLLIVRRSLTLRCQLSPEQTPRGEAAHLRIQARCRAFLPAAPLSLTVEAGGPPEEYALPLRRGTVSMELDFLAPHVGEMAVGVTHAAVSDILGLFRLPLPCASAAAPLLVLPRSFEVAPLRFLLSEEGRSAQNRTTEDLSSPEDTRSYRAGDALKRVHWKLTARKRELTVRKFETPAPPDTLILLDCAAPEGNPEQLASLRDTLCETALSVAEAQARGDAPVRVPLYGEAANEFLSDRGGSMRMLAEMLARQPFAGGVDFSRVLGAELRRMRRTGATVIITTRLDADIVEAVRHIRRMGPSARFYYITYTPEAPEDQPYIAQLQQSLVEVCYVTPA